MMGADLMFCVLLTLALQADSCVSMNRNRLAKNSTISQALSGTNAARIVGMDHLWCFYCSFDVEASLTLALRIDPCPPRIVAMPLCQVNRTWRITSRNAALEP
ncbi:uncharacterized protein BT62DRAFT_925802 [Guyanagaster necrorhizus]|uniref:Secreted protein n=1 Tax=Guyanagaster necrorhizus TaxID=856835 RepID=A0A9P8AZ82_9AGAR|nr:uncharacterized protein BT62DRAFT_925802 [Guyanagaster necrorhizus MCA 3950]KAG7453260.1 hypothetical protein BT62DRAFT_925802 [Guyanagaster necrorhizus MCA 3950]